MHIWEVSLLYVVFLTKLSEGEDSYTVRAVPMFFIHQFL
jgi:hypothetical protein